MDTSFTLPEDGGLIEEAAQSDILHRYEKIRTRVFACEQEGVRYAADRIVRTIKDFESSQRLSDWDCEEPEPFVLGLTTGRTPQELYRELARRCEAGEVSFARVAVCSLDEFYPLDPESPNSRNHFIVNEFLSRVDVRPRNVHIPGYIRPEEDCVASASCSPSERSISEYYSFCGRRIDLMVLGINRNGQVGFNEPDTWVKSRARLVSLSHETRKIESRAFFSFEDTPKMAVTMGIDTILQARQILLMAWGEEKAEAIRRVVEGEVSPRIPASYLQTHPNMEIVVDEKAAGQLTRKRWPWLAGPCRWTPKFTRKAVVWLCGEVGKPILKLTRKDYVEHSLGELLEQGRSYDKINIDVFNDLQHTITGWPGGKPGADDSTRPVASAPYPKRVLIFSPHPDDDVISMGGTFIRLVQQGHDVHVAYQTSGNVAVADDVALQHVDTARELGYGDRVDEVRAVIASKRKGEPEPRALLDIKAAIRRAEARAAVRSFGLDPDANAHFLDMPFYETGGIRKGPLSERDIALIIGLLRRVRPHQIYAAGDLADPHGTHRICTEAVLAAIDIVRGDDWMKDCHLWLYRGAWQEWDLGIVDMAVPLSPDELILKRHAIYRHLSQKDIMPFPGDDTREFWQRAEERTQHTARLYDKLGMAEYQAIEVFVKMF